MVPRISGNGTSFMGVVAYLTHDPHRAQSDDRVAWTHTLNLSNDHVPSAVDEMLWTYRDAELLKQEAGVRAGGRSTEKPLKHISLNWAPDQSPTRDHMIETAQGYLHHMGWEEHQAILVAHNDKEYDHVHIALNTIHPVTGLKLNEGFDKDRSQAWAENYERENGRIYCENRLVNSDEREKSPIRPMWMSFKDSQKEFEREENSRREAAGKINADAENPENAKSREWQALKEFQKDERTTFFADGKSAFSELRKSVYEGVREDFRGRWADYFEAVKSGGNSDELAAFKTELVAEQKTALDTRRDAACAALRETRDGEYREILSNQSELRGGLRWRQEAGLDCSLFLKMVEEGGFSKTGELTAAFKDSALEITAPTVGKARDDIPEAPQQGSPLERTGMRSSSDVGLGLAFGGASAVGSVAASLGDAFTSGRRAPRSQPREASRPGPDPFEVAAKNAREHAARKTEEEDVAYRKRQQERYWE